jgi:hypothetical protein
MPQGIGRALFDLLFRHYTLQADKLTARCDRMPQRGFVSQCGWEPRRFRWLHEKPYSAQAGSRFLFYRASYRETASHFSGRSLAAEAATLEELRDKSLVMVGELAEPNGSPASLPEIPIHHYGGPDGAHSKSELPLMPSYRACHTEMLHEKFVLAARALGGEFLIRRGWGA